MNFIYLTTNLVTKKQYIGSHFGSVNDDYFGSGKYISKSINKHGKKNFTRKILEECMPENNLLLEEKYIKEYNTLIPNGYNISPTGGHGKQGKLNEETKKKISESLKGKNHPNWNKPSPMSGKKHSPETLRKMSENRKGKEAWNKGKKWSEQTKEKISNSIKGENHPNFGKHLSEETKEKIRVSNLGKKRKPVSEETKAKISKYWTNKRKQK